MLIHALAERFARYFAQNSTHDTVIWFDPDQEYAGLLDHLTTASLWRYNGSLLALRHRLIHRTPGERAVVYLPMDKEDADLLRPFFATSDCFRDRLYRFLRHQGLAFPDDPNVDHQLRQLLPQLAVRSVGKGRQFWEYNLANLERAVNTLLGEFEGALLRFLDDPTRELTRLRQDQFEQLFFAELAGAYGLQATSDDDPDVVARDLTAELALARAYTDAGQPADFPFRDRLPQPHQVDRCLGFLDRWQHDARYAPAYARLAEKAGRLYSLDNWLESLPLADALQLGATFPDVEAVLWARLQGALAGLRSEADWSEWLAAHRHAIAARAGGFWAAHGRDPGWQVLVQAADLLREIEQMGRALPQVSRPGDMLQRYARDGWRVDAAYRAFRLALSMASGGLDPVRDRCARSYADALRAANERFSELLQSELAWPPAGALPAQDRFWAEAVGSSQKGKPFAVLFVDALRYELSEELLAQLEADRAGDSRALEARLATIPTVTPLGMAALLPDGHQRRVSHDGQWHVHIRDSGDLASKQARIDWLAGCLAGCETAFYNLNDLLDTPADRLDLVDCTVVFDTTLDAVGENADILAWDAFEPLIRSVKQGVHKLLDRGVETVHVVTDHGFLLLHEVAEHDKVAVGKVSATAVKARYLVGRGLGSTSQLDFQVPASDDLEAWFPRGVGCFRTPGRYNYAHGGLSLQELVVPHLAVRQKRMGRPVAVRVDLPTVVRQAQMQIRLEPVAESTFDQPRRVSLALEKEGEPLVPPFEATVLPSGPATIDVWLPFDAGLEKGDRAVWVLRDLLTGEVLARRETVSDVDLW